MAKRRREKMSEGKKNIIAGLIQEYDIKTAADIQEALKDLLGGTIQEMMEAELDEHLGYEEYERSDNPDYRNGVKHKTLRSSYGEIPIDVPQDRDGNFEPKIVPKRKKDISEIEQKIIAMSAKGMTTRQISDIVEDIYGFEVSESMVTSVTNKILPQIEEWQQRPLSTVYPIVFIDAIHFSVRDEHIVKKIAAYIILGVNDEGRKEVLSITVGENESAKYWLGVLNDLKNRGVQDILILCADGLSGIKESIAAAYPNTEYQRCIVHQVRNTLKYVVEKDKKAFANDLKSIYHAPSTGPLIYEECMKSYKAAYNFVKDRFEGDILPVEYWSWMLFPNYKDFFGEKSNSARFIADYKVFGHYETDIFHDAWRIFGKDAGKENLPTNTSLQRKFAQYIGPGKTYGYGKGIFLFDGENIIK